MMSLVGSGETLIMSEETFCAYCGARCEEQFCSGHCEVEGMVEQQVDQPAQEVAL